VPTPSPGPFALCNSTTCADSSTWPKITLNGNKNNGVQMSGANSALRYFQVVGPGAATSGHYGVYVSPAPSTANVTVDHLRVSGFLIGLLAVSGTLSIGADVQATANSTGLGCGATCNVVIGVGEPKTSFDKNNVGVWAIGSAALLTVNGPANMIGADHNGAVGVQYNGSLSSTLTGMVMTGNGATPSGWGSKPTGGIVVLGPSLKLRGVNIHDNTGYGAYIRQNQKSPSLSGIDFGASSSDVGGNTFKGNSLTGLCIQSTDGNFVKGNAITAIGNTFGTNVCTSGTPTLTFGPNCAAGTDVGWFNCPAGGPCDCASNMINASTCTFSISAASGLSCAQ
jgi:parallel beta-helix repeat protein